MGVRARIIDRITKSVRAPREVARLRAECERLMACIEAAERERDEWRDEARRAHAGWDNASDLLDAESMECAARIPTDIDGAQAWAERRGVRVALGDGSYHERWKVVVDGDVVHLASEPDDAISEAVMWGLFRMWRDDA